MYHFSGDGSNVVKRIQTPSYLLVHTFDRLIDCVHLFHSCDSIPRADASASPKSIILFHIYMDPPQKHARECLAQIQTSAWLDRFISHKQNKMHRSLQILILDVEKWFFQQCLLILQLHRFFACTFYVQNTFYDCSGRLIGDIHTELAERKGAYFRRMSDGLMRIKNAYVM